MSLKMQYEIEELKAKVKALENERIIPNIEHATKDDLDAFLGRLRTLEGKFEAFAKKLKP